MEKRLKKSLAKRSFTVLLFFFMMIGIMPINSFEYAGELTLEDGESITKIAELSQTAYSVDYGTEQADIGLPDTVAVTITKAAATETDEPITRTADANVVWNGTYDGNTAGDYTLTAAFADSGLAVDGSVAYPTVTVTVGNKPQPVDGIMAASAAGTIGTLIVSLSDTSGNFTDVDTAGTYSWSCEAGNKRTLKIHAAFNSGSDKTITVKVPTGYVISAYSATDSTADMSGVTKTTIDNAYKSYVTSSVLTAATAPTQIVGGNAAGTDWTSQKITGYTGQTSSIETDVRTYGGDVIYTFDNSAQTVELVLVLNVQQELLSHTAATEAMDPVTVTMSSSAGSNLTSTMNANAMNVPVVSICAGRMSTWAMTSANIGVAAGAAKSDQFGIEWGTWNYNGTSNTRGSLADSMTQTVTYPQGVFYDAEAFSNFLGLNNYGDIAGTTTYGNGHLTFTVNEDAVNGGGTLTFQYDDIYCLHGGGGQVAGAYFRANTDASSTTQHYAAGDTITGFTVAGDVARDGKTKSLGTLNFTRTLVGGTGSGKDITLTAKNTTRRDITTDCATSAYDYSLGGFGVKSALAYTGNTFFFDNRVGGADNTAGLGITALNFPGYNVRNVVVTTSAGRTITLASVSGTATGDIGVALTKTALGLADGEYISTCRFTNDMAQMTYGNSYDCGSLVYYGQFIDGQEADVKLSVLNDGSTDPADVMDNATTGLPIAATDHTTIGYTKVGVSSVATTVSDTAGGSPVTTYYPNETLHYSSTIYGGFSWQIDDTIVDPLVLISLPSGINLDTSSVTAVSASGNHSDGSSFSLYQVSGTTTQTIDGVEWTTYKFTSKNPLDMVARESLQTFNSRTGIKVSFDAVVASSCPGYNLSLKDCVQWDLDHVSPWNTTITAVNSNGGGNFVYADTANRAEKGPDYYLAAAGDNYTIKPLIGLNVDLGIHSGSTGTDPYITYTGFDGSVVSVQAGGTAQVKLSYNSTSDSDYFKDSAIYVPIPKQGVDYTKYFENVELSNPVGTNTSKTFGFTTSLTGAVNLTGDDGTIWTTYYALDDAASNPTDHNYTGGTDNWEPATTASGSAITWVTADQVTDWSKVVMLKFVAQGNITPNATGSTVMTLDIAADASMDQFDYWRGYDKAVTTTDGSLRGNWHYTSVVAATPSNATVKGQFFIDKDVNGKFDPTDANYTNDGYIAWFGRDDGTMANIAMTVHPDGSFELLDSNGNTVYLRSGDYTVTAFRNTDIETEYLFSHVQGTSTSNAGHADSGATWYNDISNDNISTTLPKATWKFTVSAANGGTQYVGVGLKGYQNLDISKAVIGIGYPYPYIPFTFKLTLTNTDGTELGSNETFSWTKSDSTTGTIASGGTFTLASGENISIANIPWGVTWKAVETDGDGYVTSNNTNGTVTYSPTATGTVIAGTGSTVAYTNDKSTVTLSGTKVWSDYSNAAGTRPDSVMLTLYKGAGTEVTGFTPTWTDNGDSTWSYSYANLPKLETDGTTISYYVTETPVTGYNTTYSGDGKAADGGTITNTLMAPDAVTAAITGSKTLTGDGKTTADIKANQFGFTVTRTDTNGFTVGNLPSGTIYAQADTGALDFGTWSFEKAGTYTFTISENDVPAGFTKAADVYVTIEVTLNTETNKLEAKATYTDGNVQQTTLSFANTYTYPDSVPVEITGNKTLTGAGKTTADIKENQFTFAVTADGNNPVDGVSGLPAGNVGTAVGGALDFGTLTFTKTGTYKFTFTENDLKNTGYTYDKSVYSVKIVVTLNEQTNKLEAETTITKDDKAAEAIAFDNNYSPIPVTDDVTAQKAVTGNPASASKFTLILTAKNAAYPMPEGSVKGVKEVTRTGAGSVEFGKITITKAGTYVYTITEKNNGVKNYTYDTTNYTVTYVVTDNNGTLEVVRTIMANDKTFDTATFTNTYKVATTPANSNASTNSNTPQTGDNSNSNMPLWLTVMILSLLGLGVCFIVGKKKAE